MIDPAALLSIRARVELELACGQKDLVAALPPDILASLPAQVSRATAVAKSAARPPSPSPRPPARAPSPVPVPAPSPLPVVPSGPARSTSEKLAYLTTRARELSPCTRCALSKGRTQVVYGVGNPDARILFVGEGPGADEDRLGEPFVGKAGQLLDKIIEAMGLRRADVYIANVVKCRPPGNRVPQFEEIQECVPFLLEQIDAIRPELLIALGATAARTLLNTQASMGSLRGRFFEFRGTPLLCTYHPAYLLRNPADKRKVWEDMQLAMKKLGLTRPAAPAGE